MKNFRLGAAGLAMTLAALVFLFTSQTVSAQAIPGPGVFASTDAHYHGAGPGPDSQMQTGTDGGPAISVNARSYEPVGGPFGMYAEDAADGRARASLPGTIGVYANAGGASPSHGVGTGVFATATARQVTNWVVNNSADPNGTTALDLAAFYDGFLYHANFVGNLSVPVTAEISATMNLITPGGTTTVFDASGILDLSNPAAGVVTTFMTSGGHSDTGWVDSFVQNTVDLDFPTSELLYEQDYFEFFEDLFVVENNVPFAFESIISVTTDNQAGAFELLSTANYLNSGDFTFDTNTAGSDIQGLNPSAVPEPSTNLAMALLLGVALAYRRRWTGRKATNGR